MKLSEALKVIQATRKLPALPVALVCGFTPLHLETFLRAQLCIQFPDRAPEVRTGLFGDLLGNLARIEDVFAAAVVIEWSDLDPRLGLRSLGGWDPEQLGDILDTAGRACERIAQAIKAASVSIPIAVCFPTLPLPPLSFTRGTHASEFTLELRSRVSALGASVGGVQNVRVADPNWIERLSLSERLDAKSDLTTGFPYTLAHASRMAEGLALLIRNPLPKKGLITDLDDTLWKGTLGDAGVEGIAWDLDGHAQIHGLYQQLLSSLAAAGTLIAVASKNDADLVQEAFSLRQPILTRDRIYPFEVHWGAKSSSVSRILQAWNISADQVVFVDDSSMDLAEVTSVHPEIECLQFPNSDYQAAYILLVNLRDLFGKERISQEDSLRLRSLRTGAVGQKMDEPGNCTSFQAELGAKLSLSFQKLPVDPRSFELVNKTNQFNLNGRRYQETEWHNFLAREDTVLLTASYTDKFGPLGKIAVLRGTLQNGNGSGRTLCIDTWVMSCRAFSRLIEYACLHYMFRRFEVEEIEFHFFSTQRNGPMRDFLGQFKNGDSTAHLRIARETFARQCPPLSHTVEEVPNA